MNKLLLFLIIISSFAFTQEFKITKVIDNNIFQLEDGRLVQLAEVYVPGIKEPNEAVRNLAMQINKWANSLLVDHNFWIRFITKDSLSKIRLIRSYMFGDEDITRTYILKGYAIFKGDTNSTEYMDYLDDQNTARNNKKGIWSLEPEALSVLGNGEIFPKRLKTVSELKRESDEHRFITESYIKSKMPYLPLLALSAVSFALAWDFFSQSSDIQNAIDLDKKLLPNGDYSDLESSKTRKTIIGIVSVAAGIVITIFSFEEVQVKTDLHSFTVSYRF